MTVVGWMCVLKYAVVVDRCEQWCAGGVHRSRRRVVGGLLGWIEWSGGGTKRDSYFVVARTTGSRLKEEPFVPKRGGAMAKKDSNRYVVSVLVADRVGILRDVTSAVTDMGANIDGISQTVVAGYFTVILTATFSKSRTPDSIRDTILENFAHGEAAVVVRLYEAESIKRMPDKGRRYIMTITGKDKPKVLKTVTNFLAEKNINIEDWYVDFDGGNVRNIGEVSVPKTLDIKQVQDEFQLLLSSLGLTSNIQHENIFRATNEIGAIGALLRGGR